MIKKIPIELEYIFKCIHTLFNYNSYDIKIINFRLNLQ